MNISLKKTLRILANPFVLSLVPAMIIIIAIPIRQEKYYLELESHLRSLENEYIHYEDLDGDGYSEKILLMHYFSRTRFSIYQHSGAAIDEWSIDGNLNFVAKENLIISGDYNSSGYKELFFFTLLSDSIFLHGPFDFRSTEGVINKHFVAQVGSGNPHPDPKIIRADMEDLDGDGAKELIFGVFTGYSLFPRQVFGYFIDKDSLISSPESFYQFSSILQADITRDGKRELLLSGAAPSNIMPDLARYHDHSNWIMVLDQNLQFLFEPVEIPGKFNGMQTLVLPGDNGPEIGCVLTGIIGNSPPAFFRFSASGELLEEIPLTHSIDYAWVSARKDGRPVIGMSIDRTDLGLFDGRLEIEKSIPTKGFYLPSAIDLNGDGHQELIAFNHVNSQLHVYRPGFRHPASAGIEWSDKGAFNISVRHNGALSPQISFQVGRDQYLFNYCLNPYFYLKFPIYLGIYFSVLLFTWLALRLQKRQMLRTFATEKRITELQLSLVKNQLDPHFSLNALNAIVEAARSGKIDRIEKGLMHFAGMYRNMLLTAGQLRQSLADELLFTKNYLELEIIRFEDRINYDIQVGDKVDTNILVPKMLVQVHAENAVKHGFTHNVSGGLVRIDVQMNKQVLQITISDNGIGRQAASHEEKKSYHAHISTGKGLALMKDFYELYQRYYKQRIISEITDLYNENGTPAGTSVLISIHLQEETGRIIPF